MTIITPFRAPWRAVALGLILAFVLSTAGTAANATKIERITSPGGVSAWLVREPAVPVIAMDFAFRGGASQDPTGTSGVANLASRLLDEGAGDLNARAYQDRMERIALELRFRAGQDYFRGSLRTLAANKDEAVELLRLALTAPRFDDEAVERIRADVLSSLKRDATNPNVIARRSWYETAFAGHPYGRDVSGTIETLAKITAGDLKDYTRRAFARDNLAVAIVGDIDAAAAGKMLDQVFGSLPAKADLRPIAGVAPQGLGRRVLINLDVPQTVMTFGGPGIARSDPDFMAAYIINHILSGGSFTSRLYREVREKRGLAYSVAGTLMWYRNAALFVGGTATRADRSNETMEIIEREIRRLANEGPTDEEFAKAKSYLKGSFALGLDTSSKIARQLLQMQLDNLGIDYIDRRGDLIDAVTIEDARRVAKRLLDAGLLVTVVGRPDTAAAAKPAKGG
jgi:zinc protease